MKPLWVRIVNWSAVLSVVTPMIVSFFSPHSAFWQLWMLIAGSLWVAWSGVMTMFWPFVFARYWAGPSMVGPITAENTGTLARWYFRIAGLMLLLVGFTVALVGGVLLLHPLKP